MITDTGTPRDTILNLGIEPVRILTNGLPFKCIDRGDQCNQAPWAEMIVSAWIATIREGVPLEQIAQSTDVDHDGSGWRITKSTLDQQTSFALTRVLSRYWPARLTFAINLLAPQRSGPRTGRSRRMGSCSTISGRMTGAEPSVLLSFFCG